MKIALGALSCLAVFAFENPDLQAVHRIKSEAFDNSK